MNNTMTKEQEALYKHIDEILFYKWDPIGISSGNWPRDEYESYLPTVYSLVVTNSEPSTIVDYLTQSRARMGLSESLVKDIKIAELLLLIKEDYL